MAVYVLALLIGVLAGLRAMTAPAVVSWAAYLGRIHVEGTWFAFLGYALSPYILSALALAELVTDQLPKTPSRKVPMQFGARMSRKRDAAKLSKLPKGAPGAAASARGKPTFKSSNT